MTGSSVTQQQFSSLPCFIGITPHASNSDSDNGDPNPSRKKHRPFTPHEREVINLYFDQYIREGTTPSLENHDLSKNTKTNTGQSENC